MKTLLHSSFLWLFASGFALGAIGLREFHPVQATTPAAMSAAR